MTSKQVNFAIGASTERGRVRQILLNRKRLHEFNISFAQQKGDAALAASLMQRLEEVNLLLNLITTSARGLSKKKEGT